MTETQALGKNRILCVDDEENVLRSLKRLFMDEDFETLTALSGKDGLSILEDNEVSVIVSDQRMPEMSGAEFLEKTKEKSPDSVRIVLTGYADINAAINAINKGGAYRYITKPWNDNDLILAVRDAVEKYRLIKENRYLTELTKKQNEELKKWNTQLETLVQEQTVDIQNQNKELQKLNEQLSRNFRNSIEAFSGLIEMRDRSVSSHSKNVAELARQTAVAMSLNEQDISNIIVASLLHDVGKIGVPDSVLLKNENELTQQERKEYEMHPIRGQVAVDAIEEFREVGILIRQHHERVDGQGYPDKLKKNDIQLGSRIIAIADAVDRTANSSLSTIKNDYQSALRTIESNLDTKFDRQIFQFMRPVILEKARTTERQDYSKELEIHPDKLAPGMILTRDVRSGTGMLLLAGGIILDQKTIIGLKRYYEIDPPKTGVFILKQ